MTRCRSFTKKNVSRRAQALVNNKAPPTLAALSAKKPPKTRCLPGFLLFVTIFYPTSWGFLLLFPVSSVPRIAPKEGVSFVATERPKSLHPHSSAHLRLNSPTIVRPKLLFCFKTMETKKHTKHRRKSRRKHRKL